MNKVGRSSPDRVFATVDAEVKLEILFDNLSRIRHQHARILEITRMQAGKTDEPGQVLERMQAVLAELSAERERFIAGGGTRGSALNDFYREPSGEEPTRADALFLRRTFTYLHALSSII